MISRRNLRVKVMQTLYAYRQEAFPTEAFAENILKNNLLLIHKLACFHLYILENTLLYSLKMKEIRAQQYLKEKSHELIDENILQGIFFQKLNADTGYAKAVKSYGFKNYDTEDFLREHCLKALSSDYYKRLQAGEHNSNDESDLFLHLYDQIVEDESFFAVQEDFFNASEEDFYIAGNQVKEIIEKKIKGSDAFSTNSFLPDQEHREFATNLLARTIEKQEYLLSLINPMLHNWESDRVADVDMCLLLLAGSELLYFPAIPVKVTINEYIDIAKQYSTPKSGEFINGILDKLLKHLTTENLILKTGRGLVN